MTECPGRGGEFLHIAKCFVKKKSLQGKSTVTPSSKLPIINSVEFYTNRIK